jgi:hypothetical protein
MDINDTCDDSLHVHEPYLWSMDNDLRHATARSNAAVGLAMSGPPLNGGSGESCCATLAAGDSGSVCNCDDRIAVFATEGTNVVVVSKAVDEGL